MLPESPHYLLYTEGRDPKPPHSLGGTWRFVLQSLKGAERLEANERELETCGERLALLAVVRGLESLDQPSHVTLLTPSRYVIRGLRQGIPRWREEDWLWEKFGQKVPVRDRDLWRRVDNALKFHNVEGRFWRLDPALGRNPSSMGGVPRPHVRLGPRTDPRGKDTPPRRVRPDHHSDDAPRTIRVIDSRQRRLRSRNAWPEQHAGIELSAAHATGWAWGSWSGRFTDYLSGYAETATSSPSQS